VLLKRAAVEFRGASNAGADDRSELGVVFSSETQHGGVVIHDDDALVDVPPGTTPVLECVDGAQR